MKRSIFERGVGRIGQTTLRTFDECPVDHQGVEVRPHSLAVFERRISDHPLHECVARGEIRHVVRLDKRLFAGPRSLHVDHRADTEAGGHAKDWTYPLLEGRSSTALR